MSLMTIASNLLLAGGIAFMAVSVLGLARLPDLYSRAHGVAKSETFGLVLVFTGLLLQPDIDIATAVRLVLILLFALLANPTAVHALVRAAFRSGALPQVGTDQAAADAALRGGGRGRRTARGGHDGEPSA
jgi:monovalent cation/proton antiporter MnhG/PhaG subunit